MTRDEIRTAIISELERIAPETEPDAVPPQADLREELDIDSMDFLNFVTALHARFAVNVPEVDYPRLYTLQGAVDYFAERVA